MGNILKLQSALRGVLDQGQIIDGTSSESEPFLLEKRGNFTSQCACILLPNSTVQVSEIVKLCNTYEVSIVPQSGNTGLVGGSVATSNQVILSSRNLGKVLEVDKNNYSMTLQAGVVLKDAQDVAEKHNMMFPLSLPSEKSCTIGGNLASNAGGISVIKYGSIKDITLGVEVVLPDGSICSDLNLLRKRNIGSDFKSLFIGSEGIFGFITAGSFKLVPKPKYNINLLLGVESIQKAEELFHILYDRFYNSIGAFEIFNHNALDVTLRYFKDLFFPLKKRTPWYMLVSFDLMEDDEMIISHMKKSIMNIMEVKFDCDYYIGNNKDLWQVRFHIPLSQKLNGESLKHDISLPLGKMADFIENIVQDLDSKYPNILQPVIFGHMGDGNLHFNIAKNDNFQGNLGNYKLEIKKLIVDKVMELRGTFSAEHGVGLVHRSELEKFYFHNQLNNLKSMKECLDPKNIFNPLKII